MRTNAFYTIIYSIFLVCFQSNTFSQSVIWNKTYGENFSEHLNSLIIVPGGYLAAGYTSPEDVAQRRAFYIKTNSEGDLIWQKTKESTYFEYITDCTNDSKNNVYLLGNSEISKDQGNVVLFLKISDTGEILFEKKFAGGEKQIAAAFAKNKDDEFIIAGSFENKSDRDKDLWILKLDKKGARIWQAFSDNRYNEDAANDVIITPDDEYVAAGWIRDFKTQNIDCYIVKFNKYGQKVWKKSFGSEDEEQFNTITLTQNNEYIVAGSIKSAYGKNDALIMRIDKNGNLLWQKKIGGNADDEIQSIIVDKDNFIAAGYTTDIASNDKQMWLLKIAADGTLIGDFATGKKLSDALNDVLLNDKNEVICAGWSDVADNGKSDAFLLCMPEKFEGAPKQIITAGTDTEGPIITIISPLPDEKGIVAVEANKPRQIVGKVEDASDILDLTVNGNKISPNAEGIFTVNLPQTETNAKIRAIDKLGNYSEKSIFFSTGGKLEPLNAVISNISNFNRVALVIGNASYHSAPLKNPVNDAKSIGLELKNLNFNVIMLTDASYKEMKKGISDFGTELAKDRNTIGLFYYAGHGIQLKGKNFIVPVDEKIEKEADVEVYAIELDDLMANLEYAGNTMNIIILDACRNNPFSRSFRSAAGTGLAATNAPVGTFVAYATAPGSTAADGSGKNGLYTQELLKTLKIPNLKIEDVFKKVRTSVKEKSNGEQIPWENSALEGDFIFKTK